MKIQYRFISCLLCVKANLAADHGYWTKLKIETHQVLERDSLADGMTSYGSSAYQEGCAADRRFYPEGTRLFVVTGVSGKKLQGKWFTVDDTHPETVRKKGLVHLRFLTDTKANQWKRACYRVYVVLPSN